jgi:hypothetical protein
MEFLTTLYFFVLFQGFLFFVWHWGEDNYKAYFGMPYDNDPKER